MLITQNEHGVPQFHKGDARRLFVLAAAIDKLSRPTLSTLSEYTGHNKGTISSDIQRLTVQYGIAIIKEGPVYSIKCWGDVLKAEGVRKVLSFT
jgi:hypothetical protein